MGEEPTATPGWIVGFDAFDAHEALCSLVASALSPLPRGSWRLVARPPHWPRLPTDFVAIEVTAAADVGSTSRAARRLLTQQAGRIAGSRTRVRGVWPRRWYTAERPSPSPAGGGGPRRRPLGSSASQTQPTSRDVTGRGKQTPYNFITKAYNASRWWSRDATGEWQSCARRFRDLARNVPALPARHAHALEPPPRVAPTTCPRRVPRRAPRAPMSMRVAIAPQHRPRRCWAPLRPIPAPVPAPVLRQRAQGCCLRHRAQPEAELPARRGRGGGLHARAQHRRRGRLSWRGEDTVRSPVTTPRYMGGTQARRRGGLAGHPGKRTFLRTFSEPSCRWWAIRPS